MRIRQYTYFAIKSRDLSAEEVEHRLRISPDRTLVAGSDSTDPLRPAAHSWALVADEDHVTVEEQIRRLVARLQPASAAISELVSASGVATVLQVVRYFNDKAGDGPADSGVIEGMEKLPGQHHLLGWHLDAEVIRFLAEVKADFDVDEYG